MKGSSTGAHASLGPGPSDRDLVLHPDDVEPLVGPASSGGGGGKGGANAASLAADRPSGSSPRLSSTLAWVPPKPRGPCGMSGKKKHVAVAAAILLVTCGIGVLIAVVLDQPATRLTLPESFQASLMVAHKRSDAPPYTGEVHKVTDADGGWLVSARVVLPSASTPSLATVVTAINSRVYWQLVNTTSGQALSAPECGGPHAVPPLAEARLALEGATVVDEEMVAPGTSSRVACVEQGHEVTAVKWSGQSYLACELPNGGYHLEGYAFSASVVDVVTPAAPQAAFAAPVDPRTGEAPECPELALDLSGIELPEVSSTHRRLMAGQAAPSAQPTHLLGLDWFLPDRHMSEHTRRRLAVDPGYHATLADARAAMAARRLETRRALDAAVADNVPGARRRRLDHDDDECCNCRRRRRRRLDTGEAADEGETAPKGGTEDDDDEVPTTSKATAWSAVDFFQKVMKGLYGDESGSGSGKGGNDTGSGSGSGSDDHNDKPSRRSRLHEYFSSFFRNQGGPNFCVCCLIPGLETPGGWRLPGFCTETVHVNVDVSKAWDNHEEQEKLCQQITDAKFQALQGQDTTNDGWGGGSRISNVALFGLSSGNLMLAGAMANGTCGFDRGEDDVVWTVVEGLLNNVDDPYLYCAEPLLFTVRLKASMSASDRSALVDMARGVTSKGAACRLDTSQFPPVWVPTSALLAIVDGYPGLDDAVSLIADNATAVVASISDIYNITYNTTGSSNAAHRNETTGSSDPLVIPAPPLGLLRGDSGLYSDPSSKFMLKVDPDWVRKHPDCVVTPKQQRLNDDVDGCALCIVEVACNGTAPYVALLTNGTITTDGAGGKLNGTPRNGTLGFRKMFARLRNRLAVLPTGVSGSDLAGYSSDPYWGVLGFTKVPGDSGMVPADEELLGSGSGGGSGSGSGGDHGDDDDHDDGDRRRRRRLASLAAFLQSPDPTLPGLSPHLLAAADAAADAAVDAGAEAEAQAEAEAGRGLRATGTEGSSRRLARNRGRLSAARARARAALAARVSELLVRDTSGAMHTVTTAYGGPEDEDAAPNDDSDGCAGC